MNERRDQIRDYHERAQFVYGAASAAELPTAYRIAICLFVYLRISKAYDSAAEDEGKMRLRDKGNFGCKDSLL